MILTRIVKLPRHNSVLVGRDLDNVFKPNMVYSVRKYLGEIVLSELGEGKLSEDIRDSPNVFSDVKDIIKDSRYLLVEGEI